MGNNFFLEGPIQTGKSTLIRKALGADIDLCGGFTTQRVFDCKGDLFGFRLGPSDTTPLTGELSKLSEEERSGFFRYADTNGYFCTDIAPFETIGIDCLLLKGHQKLFLIDEIGGIELLSPSFTSTLFSVLESDTPCIGVIKLRENMERIRTSDLHEKKILHGSYDRLRTAITCGENSRITYCDPDTDELTHETLISHITLTRSAYRYP